MHASVRRVQTDRRTDRQMLIEILRLHSCSSVKTNWHYTGKKPAVMKIHIQDPTVRLLHRPNVSFIHKQPIHGITVTILVITQWYLSSNKCNHRWLYLLLGRWDGNRKMGNSNTCKIVPLKISSWNFAYVITSVRLPAMQISVSIGTVGASPQIGEMLPLCDFLTVRSCPYLVFRDPAPRSNHWTDFHALWLKRHISVQGWSFWRLEWWVTIFGGSMPAEPLKMGVSRQF